jgi:hypothetical protein
MFPMRFVIPRRLLVLLAVFALAGAACSSSGAAEAAGTPSISAASGTSAPAQASAPASVPSPSATQGFASGSFADLACSLPHEWLLRTWRGNRDDRSAELQILPFEPNYVGSGLPHVGPWPYAQDIPMFWYGPGHVAPAGVVDRPVTLAGIAPTQGELLGFPFRAPDGSPMREAVAGNQTPPRLIITIVWDAAGRNVLDRWPNDWPFLASLIPDGTWYERGTVGSSPTSTAQTHATIGTGSFPDDHGIVAHRLRIGEELTTPWKYGPAYLIDPTLADLYDHAMGNEPIVGELGTVSIHLGMLGHGSMWGGGDKDIAAIREKIGAETLGDEGFEWNLTPVLQPYYTFPDYLNDVPGFEEDVRAVDAADGQLDGRWRSNDISQLLSGFDTPARIPYQTRVLEELITREGFGADEVPDLLFVNYKMIDYISHVWTVNSPEMKDAVRAQDESLEELVGFLNRQVGEGEWALVLTADHGSIPDPEVSGAFAISAQPIVNGINTTFDTDGDETKIVQLVQPTQIFVNEAELQQNGFTLEDVARWILGLTKADTAPPGTTVPPEEAGDLVFQAAFPSSIMSSLPCLPEARR